MTERSHYFGAAAFTLIVMFFAAQALRWWERIGHPPRPLHDVVGGLLMLAGVALIASFLTSAWWLERPRP